MVSYPIYAVANMGTLRVVLGMAVSHDGTWPPCPLVTFGAFI